MKHKPVFSHIFPTIIMLLTKDRKHKETSQRRKSLLSIWFFSWFLSTYTHTHPDMYLYRYPHSEKQGTCFFDISLLLLGAMSRLRAHQCNFVSEFLRDLKFLNPSVHHWFSFLMEVLLVSQKNQFKQPRVWLRNGQIDHVPLPGCGAGRYDTTALAGDSAHPFGSELLWKSDDCTAPKWVLLIYISAMASWFSSQGQTQSTLVP